MTTAIQDTEFMLALGFDKDTLLDLAIRWISRNLNPDDVFSTKQLDQWAIYEGWVWEGRS